ncbi:MAG: class I SAM-dependent methyltransferase, partial [Phycisphaerae bacterium]
MNPRYIAQQLIPILFEDDHFLVIPKPAGVEVAARRELPGTGLTDIIAAVRGRSETLDAVNRLGRWESGILLLAKDREALRTLRGDLRSNRILHTYLAVVVGRPAMRRTLIDASHGSSRGRRHGARDQDKRRTGIGPAHDKRRETRRPRRDAVIPPTEVRVLRSVATRSLVHVRTTSASAHVVRAQLRAAGLRLLDRRGRAPDPRRRPTGSDFLHLERLSWHHPHRRSDRVINSAPAPGFAAALKGETDVQRSLTAALVRRLPLIIESGTDSFRLITGNVEDMEGLVAEKYGRFIVLQVREKRLGAKRWVMEIARWYRRTLASEAVYVKQITRGETASDEAALAALRSPEPLLGATLPQETQIHELGLNYLVRPYDGASVGLYLDHRDNRRRVRSLAKNKDVLNLFSYTCSFSVAAAAGGAA